MAFHPAGCLAGARRDASPVHRLDHRGKGTHETAERYRTAGTAGSDERARRGRRFVAAVDKGIARRATGSARVLPSACRNRTPRRRRHDVYIDRRLGAIRPEFSTTGTTASEVSPQLRTNAAVS